MKWLLRALPVLLIVMFSVSAFASSGEGELVGTESMRAFKYFAYFLGVSIAALGGTLGQSRAIAAALEGIARNPNAAAKIQTPMILGLALIESLVIFTLASPFVIGK
jgi:F-type H+-transporting ATPase subunit c